MGFLLPTPNPLPNNNNSPPGADPLPLEQAPPRSRTPLPPEQTPLARHAGIPPAIHAGIAHHTPLPENRMTDRQVLKHNLRNADGKNINYLPGASIIYITDFPVTDGSMLRHYWTVVFRHMPQFRGFLSITAHR